MERTRTYDIARSIKFFHQQLCPTKSCIATVQFHCIWYITSFRYITVTSIHSGDWIRPVSSTTTTFLEIRLNGVRRSPVNWLAYIRCIQPHTKCYYSYNYTTMAVRIGERLKNLILDILGTWCRIHFTDWITTSIWCICKQTVTWMQFTHWSCCNICQISISFAKKLLSSYVAFPWHWISCTSGSIISSVLLAAISTTNLMFSLFGSFSIRPYQLDVLLHEWDSWREWPGWSD